MRIAILSSGRFWLCDLARELESLGHDVLFYSLVPSSRTARFGLPKKCNKWLALYVAPLYGLAQITKGTIFEHYTNRLLLNSLDWVASMLIEPCDVFIGLSGMSLRTINAVRSRYNARIFVERGSRHILSQKEILDNLPGRQGKPSLVPDATVEQELAEYELADLIVVPSKHVADSFTEHGIDEKQLFINPYGVDLTMFPATPSPPTDLPPQIIMVGIWSLRKGCDILVEAWRKLEGVRLLHVGTVADCPLPELPGFEHYPPVDQSQLTNFYAKGHVFALASREEGLALVQAQALASGLHLVCTDRTGGEDLKQFVAESESITVVPTGDVDALAIGLRLAVDQARLASGLRDYLGDDREKLSWRSYGKRYDQEIAQRV